MPPRALFLTLALVSSLSARLPLADLHVDIDIGWDGTAPTLEWFVNDEWEGTFRLAPDGAYARIDIEHSVPRPAGPAWDFLGVAAGETVWFAPQSQEPGKIYLGIGAAGLPPGIFSGNAVTLRLLAVSGPGEFALWRTAIGGAVTPLWTTADGLDATDTIAVTAGAHLHQAYGFTAPGIYTLTLEARGERDGQNLVVTGDFVFAVGVPFVEPPAPGTYATWLATHLDADQRADPALAAPSSDPDGDGRSNLLEYAFDTAPLTPDQPAFPPTLIPDADGHLVFTHRIPPDRDDLTLVVEWSPDLVTWHADSAHLAPPATTPAPDGGVIVTTRALVSTDVAPRQFFRLRALLAD